MKRNGPVIYPPAVDVDPPAVGLEGRWPRRPWAWGPLTPPAVGLRAVDTAGQP